MRSSGWLLCSSAGLALSIAAAPLPAQDDSFELPASRAELEQRAARDSNDPAAHYNLALALWNDDEYQRVYVELGLALRLDPRFAQAHLALAYLPRAERRPRQGDSLPSDRRARLRDAHLEYSRALAIDPLVDFSISRVWLPPRPAYVYSSGWYAQMYDHFVQGYVDFYRGDYASAERRLAWLIHKTADPAKVPDDLRWFHGLAAAHLAHYDDAISDFDTLLVRSRRREHSDSVQQFVLRTAEYLYVLGVMEQKAGRADTARALYEQAGEEDAGLFMAHVHLADMYEAQGVLGAAAAERASAVNIAPDDASLWLDLGLTLYKSGRLGEAETALTQGRNVNQRDARLAYVLGLTELALQRPDAARAALANAVALAPSRYTQLIADARQHLATLH